jgi:hypothetical protein
MIIINNELSLNVINKNKVSEYTKSFKQTIKDAKVMIELFYSIKALRTLNNDFKAKDYISQAVLDKFKSKEGFNLGVNENRATSYCTLLGFELEKMLSDNQQLLYD